MKKEYKVEVVKKGYIHQRQLSETEKSGNE